MLRKVLILTSFLILGSLSINAQVTTATIYGTITDSNGEALVAASVKATHTPSGSIYGTTTRDDGGFTIPNLRIGGPYSIEASYIGYETQTSENIFVNLAQKLQLNYNLTESATELEQVVVSAAIGSDINPDRTGPSTIVSSLQLRSLPSINRSAADYYRLNPAAAGNSFGGRNDQYNNFSLDGSIFNNPFGLDAATPGGQTNAQPIPLDAIEQIQVAIAPFDVTQAGFTGAAINTVTKSGTNDFTGTAYAFYRDENMTGGKVSGNDIFVPDLTQLQTGFSIGGPLVKNKVFFFATYEIERRDDLGSNFLASRSGVTGDNVSRVLASDLEDVSNALSQRFGYDTGTYEKFSHATDNQKAIFKLDFNLNQNHTITAKYNFLDAFKEKPAHPSAIGNRGPDLTVLQFRNSGYRINNIIHSGIVEWKALFSNTLSNKLQVGFTKFKDSRDPFSDAFPVLNINSNGSRYIVAGHEPFSINNRLDQEVFQFTNNLSVYAGQHTLTFGVSLERFNFDNSFNLGVNEPFQPEDHPNPYPGGTFGPGFNSVDEFLTFLNAGHMDEVVDHARATFENNNNAESWALAETNVGQLAVYVQDEFAATNNLTLTLGLRVDMPLYFDTEDKIKENLSRTMDHDPTIVWYDETGAPQTFDHSVLPDQTPLFSPRFGFNYDVYGDQTMQLRGGSGLFTGRFPFVWIGNHIANPNWFFYNYTKTDFKFPQVWKTNIGVDKKFGNGWTGTVDLLYNKDINSMMVRNYGIKPPTGKLTGVDNRDVYTFDDRAVFTGFGFPIPVNGYVFTNSDKGYAFNATAQIKRDWGNNFITSLSYNYNISKDVSSIEAEISSDAYDRNPAFGHVNDDVLAHSLYGNRHRVMGTLFKTFNYGDGKYATSIAAFFEYAEGSRFSYTYSGDINGDGSGLNDLIFVPDNSQLNQMNFVDDAQRNAYKAFIEQDEYLSSRRGDYAEKYAILAPWFSTWDVRVLQDFNFDIGDRTNTIQLSLDILNIGNLINSDWGVRQFPTTIQPVSVVFDGNGDPLYGFDETLTKTFTDDFSLLSRWQLQLGLRYIF